MNASRQLAWSVAVFACNEAKRVRRSLQQFPADVAGHAIQVSVFANGCTDRTESVVKEFARSQPHISLHASQIADKANAWNLYIHEKAPPAKVHFFTDANKTIQPGSLQRLAKMLELNTGANAAASVPMNGRSRRTWRASIVNGQRVAGGALCAAWRVRAAIAGSKGSPSDRRTVYCAMTRPLRYSRSTISTRDGRCSARPSCTMSARDFTFIHCPRFADAIGRHGGNGNCASSSRDTSSSLSKPTSDNTGCVHFRTVLTSSIGTNQ